jgi:hypothetical protein
VRADSDWREVGMKLSVPPQRLPHGGGCESRAVRGGWVAAARVHSV